MPSQRTSRFPALRLLAIACLSASLGHAQYLRIRVTMENGDPPPRIAEIEEFCMDGAATKIGVTNAEGYFFPGVGLINDPGELGPDDVTTTLNSITCQLRAILSGYVSSIAAVPRFNPMFTSAKNVVRITLHKAEQTEGYRISATSGLAPKGARKNFEDGMNSMEHKHWENAEKFFLEAVKMYDRYAEAWLQLGKAYREMEKPEEARAAFLKAVEADPRYEYPYEDLYQLAFERDDMEDLLQQAEALLRLDPYSFPGAYYYSAVANLQLKHYAAGEERIRTAIADDPEHKQPM